MKNGDIVWANIREESSRSCYWPGLIQTTDSHGVFVSFFNHQTPRYFHPSEIHPFSDDLLDSMATELGGACDALLDSALRWLCRRTARSLRCQCRSKTAAAEEMAVVGDGEAFEAKKSFRPEAVLEFVKSKALLAWVEVGDFVEAVKSVAEIQVFRDYSTIEQKSVYRNGKRARRRYDQTGTHIELQAYPSSDSVASQSYNVGLDYESHASPKREEKKMKADVASITDSSFLLSKASFQQLHEDQLEKRLIKVQKEEEQSVYEDLVNLQLLAVDSFCLGASCLNTTKQNLLGFRSILFEKVSDMHIKKCSSHKRREAYFSVPGFFESQPSVEAEGKQCESQVCGSVVPYIERPVSGLGSKRRLDLHAFCESTFKLSKRMPFFLINGSRYYLQIKRTQAEVNLCKAFFAYNGIDFYLDRNGTDWKEASNFKFLSKSSVKLEMQNSGALVSTDASNTRLLDFFRHISYVSRFKDSARLGNITEISEDQEHNVKDAYGSYVNLQELDRSTSVVKDNVTCMYNVCNTPRKTVNGFQNEDMKVDDSYCSLRPSATQSSTCEMFGTNASDVEKVNEDAATEVSLSEFRLVSDKSLMQPSWDKGAISVEFDGKAVSLNVASEDRVEKINKLNDSCTSGLFLNSHEARQSKALSRFAGSKSLHMKFPKDYNLPSTEELVRKFRPFGPIDSLKTKIFNYTGSAQVVFFNQSDAVVAYQYAKRKKLLPGQPNVRYWLDPFESKRGAKLLTVKPLEPELKSCLRSSDSPGTEGRRKHQKVRFLMVTES